MIKYHVEMWLAPLSPLAPELHYKSAKSRNLLGLEILTEDSETSSGSGGGGGGRNAGVLLLLFQSERGSWEDHTATQTHRHHAVSVLSIRQWDHLCLWPRGDLQMFPRPQVRQCWWRWGTAWPGQGWVRCDGGGQHPDIRHHGGHLGQEVSTVRYSAVLLKYLPCVTVCVTLSQSLGIELSSSSELLDFNGSSIKNNWSIIDIKDHLERSNWQDCPDNVIFLISVLLCLSPGNIISKLRPRKVLSSPGRGYTHNRGVVTSNHFNMIH